MPNNVYCALKFSYHEDKGEKIKSILEVLKGENGPLDFAKLVPFPDDRDSITDWNKWRVDNWGTKWNAYDAQIKAQEDWKLVMHFKTAWSIPEPILKKLFEMFPGVGMSFVAVDEGLFFAYHITKAPNQPAFVRMWGDASDDLCDIRRAMLEALNCDF